ncbi:MAG: hypothetical protein ACTSPQ_22380 [Candidatus Helarchaeota archaeon]
MAKRIWTYEMRTILYKKLVEKFGPYHTWNNPNYPDGKRTEYFELIDNLSKSFSVLMNKKISSGALHQQIAWALTDQKEINGDHTSVYILNMATAYESGFLTSKSFPKCLLVERDNILK